MPTRRHVLAGGAGLGAWVLLRTDATAAATDDLAAAVAAYAGGAAIRAGRVKLDIADLVDNGNVVPITVRKRVKIS